MIYDKILNQCCRRFNLTPEEILGDSKTYRVFDGRHVMIALCYKYWIRNTLVLGKHFNRHHGSIINSVKAAQRPYLVDKFREIEKELQAQPLPEALHSPNRYKLAA